MNRKIGVLLFSMFFLFLSLSLVSAWRNSSGNEVNLSYFNNDLIMFFDFDETSGDLIERVNGLYNGTLSGSITQGFSGQIDKAYLFQHLGNAYVSTADVDLDFLTISVWVTNNVTSSYEGIVEKNRDTTFGLDIEGSTGRVRARAWGVGHVLCSVTSPSALGNKPDVWRHLAMTYNGSATTLYIDGEQVGQTLCAYGLLDQSANPIYIGKMYDGFYFDGKIDLVGIWNTSLNATDILELNNSIEYGDAIIPPTININLTNPSDNFSTNGILNYSANISCDNGCRNATLYFYNSTDSLNYSQFIDLSSQPTFIQLGTEVNLSAFVPDGEYSWFYTADDNLSTTQASNENRTITVDTNPPFFIWTSPSLDIGVNDNYYVLNLSIDDDYLDAVNVSVFNSSGDEIYNNFSDYLNITSFLVEDNITLDLGVNFIEICARDSLAGSPKIQDDALFTRRNTEETEFIMPDGNVVVREIVIKDSLGNKLSSSGLSLFTKELWVDNGEHFKTTWEFDETNVDFFEILMYDDNGDLELLTDRGKTRIVDRGRNYYWSYEDIEQAGYNVEYTQNGNVIEIKVTLGSYIVQGGRWIVDPIVGGLNNRCENRTITYAIPPTISIVFPQNGTFAGDINRLDYTYAGSCESVWYSTNLGETNSSLGTCGNNFTGLSSYLGSNTWTVFMNNSIGDLNSSSVSFTKVQFAGEIQSEASIYNVMRSAGAGFGKLFEYLTVSLPNLLILLVIVVIISTIGYAIAGVIKKSITRN